MEEHVLITCGRSRRSYDDVIGSVGSGESSSEIALAMQCNQWGSRSMGEVLMLRPSVAERVDVLSDPSQDETVRNGVCHKNEFHKNKRKEEDPSLLEVVLALDHHLTQWVAVCALPTARWQRVLQSLCMTLELSGHGVLWFTLCALLLVLHLLTGWEVLFTHGLNMLILLVMDCVVVAPVKVIFKRPRPPQNHGTIPLSVSSVDHYAFPSGHASRCVALAIYFCVMPPFYPHTHLWYVWAFIVSLSRVLIGRHHILDVVAGAVAGVGVFELVHRAGCLYGLD